VIKKSNCCCIFINQLRDKIGVLFGNPETTTGGNALKFYASIRLDVRKSTQIKDGDEVTANLTRVKVVKNKCAPPFRKAEFEIEYGKGINKFNEIIDQAINFDIIHKSGSWFYYENTQIAQGKNNVISILKDNPELLEEIEQQVKNKIINKDQGILELDDVLNEL
jgi:recombination protein RecA